MAKPVIPVPSRTSELGSGTSDGGAPPPFPAAKPVTQASVQLGDETNRWATAIALCELLVRTLFAAAQVPLVFVSTKLTDVARSKNPSVMSNDALNVPKPLILLLLGGFWIDAVPPPFSVTPVRVNVVALTCTPTKPCPPMP